MRTTDVVGSIILGCMSLFVLWFMLLIVVTEKNTKGVVVGKEYVPAETYLREYRPTPKHAPRMEEVTDPEEWILIIDLVYDNDRIKRHVSKSMYKRWQVGDTLKLGYLE